MKYFGTAVTDIGITKNANQDSACIKIAESSKFGQMAMIALCDGMGGLEKGELASATVIRFFANWFENEFPKQLGNFSRKKLAEEWKRMIKEQNYRISRFGKKNNVSLGTTATIMLAVNNKYLIAHVGDTRVYEIRNDIRQLTEDQTFIAREIKKGNMTPEQAAKDPRRNMLLQCVGASKDVEPQIITGKIEKNTVYMLCSDGFRHKLSDKEMYDNFCPSALSSTHSMESSSRNLIDMVKSRNEKDNITVALLKCFE